MSGGKPKLPESETSEVSVKEVVTQYLHTSGWLSDVSVVWHARLSSLCIED